MCGIIGAVGTPNDLELSFRILTNLLRETQKRGRHATGHFGVNLDNEVQAYKINKEAEAYIHLDAWKKTSSGLKAMIGHTRWTTQGPQTINENNHPHLSPCGNIGLVHNGVVYNYHKFKNEFSTDLISECDSELILRMITNEDNIEDGIKRVFKDLGTGGDFACELLHRDPETGNINFYFFRDNGRPGKMIDAREQCGQIFFCSEDAIWRTAMNKANAPSKIRSLKPVDIDPYKIFKIDPTNLNIEEIQVKKPVKVSRYQTVYNDDYYGGSYYQGTGSYYHNSNNNYNSKRNAGTRNSINDLSSCSKTTESVLDDDWIETVNEQGLPRFEYVPGSSKKKKLDDEDIQEIFNILVNDKSQRYSGWADEALKAGALTEDQYLEILEEENVQIFGPLEEQNEPDWEFEDDIPTLVN